MFDVIITSQSLSSRVGPCRWQLLSSESCPALRHIQGLQVFTPFCIQLSESDPGQAGREPGLWLNKHRHQKCLGSWRLSLAAGAFQPNHPDQSQSSSLAFVLSCLFFCKQQTFLGGLSLFVGKNSSLLRWETLLLLYLQTGRAPSLLWSSVFPSVKWGCWIRSAVQTGSWIQQACVVFGPQGTFIICF